MATAGASARPSRRTRILAGLLFPEGPRWRAGRLWFSDTRLHRVMTLSPAGTPSVVAECFFRPSGIGFLPDGRALVVNMLERKLVRLDPEAPTAHADLSRLTEGSINDMVVDAHGRAYVGELAHPAEGPERDPRLPPVSRRLREYVERSGQPPYNPRPSRVVRVDPDGSARIVADDLFMPNGMAITPDGTRLIVAETYGNRLVQFDVAPDGGLTNRRAFAELGEAMPDGICLDAEGAVWIASLYDGQFQRVHEGGRVSARVRLSHGWLAAACMLGGHDRRTLYMCTVLRPTRDVVPGVTRGAIEAVRVAVPGAGLP